MGCKGTINFWYMQIFGEKISKSIYISNISIFLCVVSCVIFCRFWQVETKKTRHRSDAQGRKEMCYLFWIMQEFCTKSRFLNNMKCTKTHYFTDLADSFYCQSVPEWSKIIVPTQYRASRWGVSFRVRDDVPHMHNNVRDEDNSLWCRGNLC